MINLTLYAKLLSTLELVNWKDRGVYAEWLSQQYHLVRHSVPLLYHCSAHAFFRAPKIANYVGRLADGELNHDKLLLNDLKFIKMNMAPESTEAKSIISNQYYEIQYGSPYYYLGYVYLLEKLAIDYGGKLQSIIQEHYDGGYTFLKVHNAEDIAHLANAEKMFATFTDEERAALGRGFDQACELYSAMIVNIDIPSYQLLHAS